MRSQFNPTVFYDDAILEAHPEWQADNERMLASARKYQSTMENDTVVTDDRIPKTGLFLSRFVGLGAASIVDKNSVDN